MKRRDILKLGTLPLALLLPPERCEAGIPLLGWLLRVAVSMLERQAVRSVATSGIRAMGGRVAGTATSAALGAKRANKAAQALRKLTALSLGTVAANDVFAYVQNSPEDSILRWTLAYYAVLTQSNADAAMGMWVDPPDERQHFRHLNRGTPTYKVKELVQQTHSKVTAYVSANNKGETPTNYQIEIEWDRTEHGPRISSFRSV